uniref:Uncharacterized protein n=1 Tax=Rhizophora mucronata TaxID=61149 RepID=A0A2P2ILS2_RHIMU
MTWATDPPCAQNSCRYRIVVTEMLTMQEIKTKINCPTVMLLFGRSRQALCLELQQTIQMVIAGSLFSKSFVHLTRLPRKNNDLQFLCVSKGETTIWMDDHS